LSSTALRALVPIALMGAIFYLSAQESVGPELPAFTRIVAHFTEYATLAALWAWALVPELGRRGLWAAAAISALYAVSDEYHQRLVAGRDSDVLDVVTDWAGIAFGLWLFSRSAAGRAGSRRPPTSP
jgi:VanZ family protein